MICLNWPRILLLYRMINGIKLTWNLFKSTSATRRSNLKVAVAKLRHGGGINGGDCPSTRGVASGGSSDPYNIETHPKSSVPCRVDTYNVNNIF